MKFHKLILSSGIALLCALTLAGCGGAKNAKAPRNTGARLHDQGSYVLSQPLAGYEEDTVLHITKHGMRAQTGIHKSNSAWNWNIARINRLHNKDKQNLAKAQLKIFEDHVRKKSNTAREQHFYFIINRTTHKPNEDILHGHLVKDATAPSMYKVEKTNKTFPIRVTKSRTRALLDPDTKDPQTIQSRARNKSIGLSVYSKRISTSEAKKILHSDDIDPDSVGY